MISISRLLCDNIGPGDNLRYGGQEPHFSRANLSTENVPPPIVVWNCTRQCNLRCLHCYANANSLSSPGEMDTEEGKAFICDLAAFGVPVLLFSGGEPLLREDIFELAGFAKEQGMRPALSTNGTLITQSVAERIHRVSFSEVGISLDGIGVTNDHFRGKKGAFQAALQGIRNCVNIGLRVSLRLTI
ncbi:MAG: radical SAM protein, partial [Dehalococcoidia bacterium]